MHEGRGFPPGKFGNFFHALVDQRDLRGAGRLDQGRGLVTLAVLRQRQNLMIGCSGSFDRLLGRDKVRPVAEELLLGNFEVVVDRLFRFCDSSGNTLNIRPVNRNDGVAHVALDCR